MKLKNKNFIYFILGALLVVSVSVFFLFSKSIAKKERETGNIINNNAAHLKIVQENIVKNIGKIKKIDVSALRYGYFHNRSASYFISNILRDSKIYHVKLNYIKLKYSEKRKNSGSYSFKISGYGKSRNVYMFVRALEYKDKIQLDKFLVKSASKGGYVLFYSDLIVHIIRKSYILTHVLKHGRNLNPPPSTLGIINPFQIPIMVKQHTELTKPAIKEYPLKTSHKKIKSTSDVIKNSIPKKIHKSITQESRSEKSDFYNKKGVAFFVQKKYAMALGMFKRAIAQNPSNYRALSNAALDNYEKKDYNGALFYAKRALVIKNAWQINFILGLIYLRDDDFMRARHYFGRSIMLNPSNRKIKYYLDMAEKGR